MPFIGSAQSRFCFFGTNAGRAEDTELALASLIVKLRWVSKKWVVKRCGPLRIHTTHWGCARQLSDSIWHIPFEISRATAVGSRRLDSAGWLRASVSESAAAPSNALRSYRWGSGVTYRSVRKSARRPARRTVADSGARHVFQKGRRHRHQGSPVWKLANRIRSFSNCPALACRQVTSEDASAGYRRRTVGLDRFHDPGGICRTLSRSERGFASRWACGRRDMAGAVTMAALAPKPDIVARSAMGATAPPRTTWMRPSELAKIKAARRRLSKKRTNCRSTRYRP